MEYSLLLVTLGSLNSFNPSHGRLHGQMDFKMVLFSITQSSITNFLFDS